MKSTNKFTTENGTTCVLPKPEKCVAIAVLCISLIIASARLATNTTSNNVLPETNPAHMQPGDEWASR